MLKKTANDPLETPPSTQCSSKINIHTVDELDISNLKYKTKKLQTYYVLADISNSFKWRFFQHFSWVRIGDIGRQNGHHFWPSTFRQFSACNVCHTLRCCTRHHCFAAQCFQYLHHHNHIAAHMPCRIMQPFTAHAQMIANKISS